MVAVLVYVDLFVRRNNNTFFTSLTNPGASTERTTPSWFMRIDPSSRVSDIFLVLSGAPSRGWQIASTAHTDHCPLSPGRYRALTNEVLYIAR